MKYRYSIPNELKYYGYMHKYPVKYRLPLFNHFYYLLNLSKAKQIRELLSHYLIRSEEEWKVDRLAGKIKIQNLPSFCLVPSILKQSNRLLTKGNFKGRNFSPSELIESRKKSVEKILYTFRWLREYDLSAVKNRANVQGYPLREKDVITLKKIIYFFINRGFSLQDVLIRCSTEHTLIEGDSFYLDGSADPLSLPMTHYSILWHAVKKLGFFK